MELQINLRGLRNTLRKFDENGIYAESGKWSIGKGGYDLAWELYYCTCTGYKVPIVDCICGAWDMFGTLKNVSLSKKDFKRVAKVILDEYKDVKVKENEE